MSNLIKEVNIKMRISNDVIAIFGNSKVLIYNFYINKICIINKELYYNLYKENNDEYINKISLADKIKLIKYGILIDNNEDYKKSDFYPIYLKKCASRNVNIDTVYLHLTQKCNLNCQYCYNRQNLGKNEDLDTLHIIQIINILKKLGVKKIILTGGEVLLRNDIEYIE